jgi:hypothetical protein
MKRLLTAVVAAGLLAVPAGAELPAPPAPTVPDCFSQVEAPRQLVLACADGNFSLEQLSWHLWGSARASATGEASANDCTPDCAGGTFRVYPVIVTASAPRTCPGGRRQYTRLTWATHVKPRGITNPSGETTFACSWPLHPGLTAHRAGGEAVLSGTAWTRTAGCRHTVTLTSAGKVLAAVPLTGKGTFAYRWRAPAGAHVVVARLSCGPRKLYEATAVVRPA